jgi:hypothetical protein
MFDPKSRYFNTPTVLVRDKHGRIVRAVVVPEPPRQAALGRHQRAGRERLDHLAFRYLGDAAGYWRICEINDALLPDALGDVAEIIIPRRGR